MKKIILAALSLGFVITANAGEFEKDLAHFTEVQVTGNMKVFMVQGDEEKIVVENLDNELTDDRILVEVKGSELSIKIKSDAFKKWNLTIYVHHKNATTLHAKKGAWIEIDGVLQGDALEFNCTTDGVIKANVDSETLKCGIFTSGTMRLTGKSDIAEYKVSTGGFISAVAVVAKTVVAKVSTGGDISCYGTDNMNLKVNTGGNIKYKYDGDKSNYTEKIVIAGDIKKFQGQ